MIGKELGKKNCGGFFFFLEQVLICFPKDWNAVSEVFYFASKLIHEAFRKKKKKKKKKKRNYTMVLGFDGQEEFNAADNVPWFSMSGKPGGMIQSYNTVSLVTVGKRKH